MRKFQLELAVVQILFMRMIHLQIEIKKINAIVESSDDKHVTVQTKIERQKLKRDLIYHLITTRVFLAIWNIEFNPKFKFDEIKIT